LVGIASVCEVVGLWRDQARWGWRGHRQERLCYLGVTTFLF